MLGAESSTTHCSFIITVLCIEFGTERWSFLINIGRRVATAWVTHPCSFKYWDTSGAPLGIY